MKCHDTGLDIPARAWDMTAPIPAPQQPPHTAKAAQGGEDVLQLENMADSVVKAFFLALLYRAAKSLHTLWTDRASAGVYHVLDVVILLGISGITYYTSFWKDVLKRA